MAWTNLFVLTVPPTHNSRTVVTYAGILQMGHFVFNIAALSVFVAFRPDDYEVVLVILGCGFLSLGPLCWKLRQAWRDD